MALPAPEPGLVISYSYLWRHEFEAGLEEGIKNRPCVIILAVETKGGETVVTVAPFTHLPPSNPHMGIAIPSAVKRHLGLDEKPSWVILNEVNQFAWPGYDLQFVPGDKGYAYGFLPPALFNPIKARIAELLIKRRLLIARRD